MSTKTTKNKGHVLDNPYFDKILLKIKRDHPESAGIKLLEEKLAEIKIESGKNIAYISELEDELLLLKKMSPKELSNWKLEKRTDQEIIKLSKSLETEKADKKHWRTKYLNLAAQKS